MGRNGQIKFDITVSKWYHELLLKLRANDLTCVFRIGVHSVGPLILKSLSYIHCKGLRLKN